MAIPEWLYRANDGTFPLNVSDLSNEFIEILQGQDPESIVDDDVRKRCCERLQAMQRDIDYLSSLKLCNVIAKHMRARCRGQAAEETIESWVKLDAESAKLNDLADEIANVVREVWKVQNPLGEDVSKFTEVLLLDSIDNFHHGLENLIGYPPTHADFLSSMKREHNQKPFIGRYGEVDPKIEWNIVIQSDAWNFSGVRCQPVIKIPRRECTEPLEFFVKKARNKFEDANSEDNVLNEAEVAALRLWTGPMHERYAEVLRNPQKPSGPYVTTLHAINSGITKLARIWPLPVRRKVYRGYKNLKMKVLKKDSFNCIGGVEKCVLATSEDFNIAVNYSENGAFILEIEVGQANRGADVSWLSQFPHEREILFNALSNVEFVCNPQQRIVHFKGKGTGNHTPGKLLVYQVHISANLRSKTLEEFFSLRKDLHMNLVDVLAQEALRTISKREAESSRGLIKRICAECIHQCNTINTEAALANVCIFNEGTEEYVRLVRDAIMFLSRSETIIDIALQWFDCGKADPAVVDGLLDWQFQALRDAFKDSDRPKVSTIVLEQHRNVDSLFGAKMLYLGAFHKLDTVYNVAKLLSLNPELENLDMQVASATAELWENVFNELCPDRPSLRVNGLHLAKYAISTLQQLELRNLGDHMANMIAPALLIHPPTALTFLNLCATPISCAGAESLGRAFTGLKRLKFLDLRLCKIADRGCTGIAKTLPALCELEDLTLAHNNVDDDGFNILASTIRAHGLTRLESVDMRFNTTQLPSTRCGARCVMKNHLASTLSTTARVHCVAWSPGGDQIASGSDDKTIIIWDAKTGEQISTRKGQASNVNSLAWHPEGDQIASGHHNGTIITWNAKTGDRMWSVECVNDDDDDDIENRSSKQLGHSMTVASVAWSFGGDQIASGSEDKTIIIWDAKSGKQVSTLKGHTDGVISVAWRHGGNQIASASIDETIIIWDAKNGQQVSILKGHTGAVYSVAWRPCGDQIASGSYDNTISIWDANTGNQISTLKGHTHTVTSVAWRPGGDQIASASADKAIIIWDTKAGQQVSKLKGHSMAVTSVTWCPGGDQIASGSYDKTIIIWDVKMGDQNSTLKGHSAGVTSLALRPGGDHIASGSADKTIIIWDTRTGDKISTLNGHVDYVRSVSWNPSGSQIASGSDDNTVIIWDAKTGYNVSTLKGHTNYVTSVSWSPLADQIVSCSRDNTVIIWDAKSGNQVSALKGHSGEVYSVDWNSNGNCIASGSADKTIIIWNAKSGDRVSTLRGHSGEVKSVAWSPSGQQVASASNDNTLIVWDADTGALLWQLKGHSDIVLSVAWSTCGEQVISGSRDKTVIVWDSKTGKARLLLECHTKDITSVVCNVKGQVASGSLDGTVILWDGHSCKRKTTLVGHPGSVQGGAWGPSGDKILTACSDESDFTWDAESGKRISTLQVGGVTSVARSLSAMQVSSCAQVEKSGPVPRSTGDGGEGGGGDAGAPGRAGHLFAPPRQFAGPLGGPPTTDIYPRPFGWAPAWSHGVGSGGVRPEMMMYVPSFWPVAMQQPPPGYYPGPGGGPPCPVGCVCRMHFAGHGGYPAAPWVLPPLGWHYEAPQSEQQQPPPSG